MYQQTIFRKDFSLVVIGQIISLFGNQILRFALPLYLLNQTGSSALFGTIMALSFVPMILLYPVGGIIADRINKRNIMVILDFMTAILIFLFYLMVGKMDIVPLMAITLIILCGIQGAYQPAVQASIPVLVETKQIMKGNSIVNLISSLAGMVGPIIGGVLFSFIGLMPILYISIGCFFAAAVMEIFIHIPFEKKQTSGNILVIGFNDLKDSFHFMLKEKPALWKMSLVYAAVNLFLTSLILIGIPVIITQHLEFDADTANRFYGYAMGGIAAGAISGGLLAGILSKKLKLKTSPILLIGCTLSVLAGGVALQMLSRPVGVYIILVVGSSLLTALSTLFQIQVLTYLQTVTPKDLIGKVISCVICICVCTNPIGQFIYGIIFEKLENGLYLPFYAAALIMIGIIVLTRRIFYDFDRN